MPSPESDEEAAIFVHAALHGFFIVRIGHRVQADGWYADMTRDAGSFYRFVGATRLDALRSFDDWITRTYETTG